METSVPASSFSAPHARKPRQQKLTDDTDKPADQERKRDRFKAFALRGVLLNQPVVMFRIYFGLPFFLFRHRKIILSAILD